jgi:hypothetical protein
MWSSCAKAVSKLAVTTNVSPKKQQIAIADTGYEIPPLKVREVSCQTLLCCLK